MLNKSFWHFVVGLFFGLMCGGMLALYFKAITVDQKAIIANLESRSKLHDLAVADVCKSIAVYKMAAQSLGWQTEDEDIEQVALPLNIHANRGELGYAIRIFIEPEFPFSKERGAVLFFDKNGCAI